MPSRGKPATPNEIVARIGSLEVSTSKPALGDGAPDALGDLERLVRRRLREQDRELLAAEPGRHVVLAELLAEDLRDPGEDRVAGQVPVGVVDVAQQVEVGHDQRHRPLEAARPAELVAERGREVARVVEAGLRVDARLGLELPDRERAVHQQERRERERGQPDVVAPEHREADAERGQDEVGREVVVGEEPRLAEREPAREAEHRREQDVVQPDEDDRRRDAREQRPQAVLVEGADAEDLVRDRPRSPSWRACSSRC